MATPMSVEAKILLKLLDDGQWHPLTDISAALAASIAPGKALRRYQARVNAREVIEGRPRRTPEPAEDEQIAFGQRILANTAINSLKKRHIELVDTTDGRMVHRRAEVVSSAPPKVEKLPDAEPQAPPEPAYTVAESYTCSRCGMWIVNHAQHENFHAEHDPPAPPMDMAFFNRDQVAAIVREEVQRALDEYQTGMQRFLVSCFADLELAVSRAKLGPPIFQRIGDARTDRR